MANGRVGFIHKMLSARLALLAVATMVGCSPTEPDRHYTVTAVPASPLAGATVRFTAQLVLSGADEPVLGRTVSWLISGGTATPSKGTVTTNSSGYGTFDVTTSRTIGETFTVSVQDESGVVGTSSPVTTRLGSPARYVVSLSPTAPGVGTQVTAAAQLADTNGNAVAIAGRTVTWTKVGAGGAFASPTSTTDASGIATVAFTTGSTAGTAYTIIATDNAAISGSSSPIVTVPSGCASGAAPPGGAAAPGTPASLVATGNEILILNVGATVPTAFQVLDDTGAPIAGAGINYASCSIAAATIDASGIVTGVAQGQSLIVAKSTANPALRDSIIVAVASPTGTSLGLDVTTLDLTAGATVTFTLVADMRASGEKLGALTTQLTWDPSQLTFVSDAETATNAGALVNSSNAANGSLTVSMASSGGFSGAVLVRKLTFIVTATKGKAASFSILPTEFNAATTFNNLLPKTIAIRYPLTTK